MNNQEIKINSHYMHFKGGVYKVTDMFRDAERDMIMVLYTDCTGEKYGRTISNFQEFVRDTNGDLVPRFTQIEF